MPEFIAANLNYIIWPVVLAVGIAYMLIKKNNNRKAAESGEDMQRIYNKVAPLFTDTNDLSIAYAHYEHTESYGRSTKTTYYRYVVAFRGESLWVFPMGLDKKTKELLVAQPMVLSADTLGKINVTPSQKNGTVTSVDTHLFDKNGKSIVQFTVDAENLHKSKFYPFNILQKETVESFYVFISFLAQQVASENTELEARLEQEGKEAGGTWGIILSIVGAVIGFFFAPVGLVISAIGLVIAIRGKMQGAKKNKGLIVSAVVTAVLAVWTVVWIMMIRS